MADWSEGSVLVIVGMTTPSDHLMHKGFSMIVGDGHEIAPALLDLIYGNL
jgi:hypothetical protein